MEIKACQVGLRVKYYDHEKNVWSTGKIVEQPEGQKVKVQPEKGGDTVTIMARNIRPAPAYNGVVITIDRSSIVSLEMNERGIQIKLDNSSSYDRGFVHSLNATVHAGVRRNPWLWTSRSRPRRRDCTSTWKRGS
jgi:hypothetical protein